MPLRYRSPLPAAILTALVLGACTAGSATTTSPTDPTSTAAAAATTTTHQTTVATTDTSTTTTFLPTQGEVTGVVIDVIGGLAGVDAFTVRLPDGSDLELMPGDDVLFDGVAPISHLRDHLVSGAPVTATYVTVAEGLPMAIEIGDAEGGHSHDD